MFVSSPFFQYSSTPILQWEFEISRVTEHTPLGLTKAGSSQPSFLLHGNVIIQDTDRRFSSQEKRVPHGDGFSLTDKFDFPTLLSTDNSDTVGN